MIASAAMSESLKHLFVLDPLEALLPDADTSIAFMRQASTRDDEIWAVRIDQLSIASGRPQGQVTQLEIRAGHDWYLTLTEEKCFLDRFDVIWMRKDPPFDQAFYYSTHVLSMVGGDTLVVNDPAALRDANEKLFALRFPACCPESLVSSNQAELMEFRDSLGGEMIVKPLDGAGGEGIFHIHETDRNAKAILEVSTQHGRRMILAQRYIPEIRDGDKRIILVEGEPQGAVLRVPLATEAPRQLPRRRQRPEDRAHGARPRDLRRRRSHAARHGHHLRRHRRHRRLADRGQRHQPHRNPGDRRARRRPHRRAGPRGGGGARRRRPLTLRAPRARAKGAPSRSAVSVMPEATTSRPAPGAVRRRRLLIALLSFALLAAAIGTADIGAHLERLVVRTESLGAWAPPLFVLLHAAAVVTLVPGILFPLGAGFLFGWGPGTVLSVAGKLLGSAAAFLIARHLLQASFPEWSRRFRDGHPTFGRLLLELPRGGWKTVLEIRLVPVIPFKLSSYLFGWTHFTFRDYLVGTAIASVPYSLINAYLGSLAADLTQLDQRPSPRTPFEWTLYVGGSLLALIALLLLVRRGREILRRDKA